MKIVIDRNIRGAETTFGRHGELHIKDGRDICQRDLLDADILIIRTATRVNEALFGTSRVGFVGTTSIGTDHLDIPWLNQQGIAWANAPGCNADSAAQYTLAMVWLACERLGRKLSDQRIGIIGRGNVGIRVQRLFQALGCKTVANDPPLTDSGVEGLVSLERALEMDIVCLHVPLTRDGPYPTHRFIASNQLAQLPSGALLVNSARGDVIAGPALLDALQSQHIHAALDVWPGEPEFDGELIEAATVATPHVAGYSVDGKWNGTQIVYQAYCRWAGKEVKPPGPHPGERPELIINNEQDELTQALDATCFVADHDAAMRRLVSLSREERAIGFDKLRRDYPTRRDFHAWDINCHEDQPCKMLQKLGFAVSGS